MSPFSEATAVRKTAEGRYAADLDAGYGIEQALNGGYLMAVLTRAAIDASGRPHPVVTSACFLRVARPGLADVLVETRKSGRTAVVTRVTLAQAGEPVVEALVTTGTLDADAEPAYSGGPAKLPPIEECVGHDGGNREGRFADQVDMRFDRSTMGWLDGRPTGRPEMRAHFRTSEPHEPDGVLLALAVDSLPPVVLNAGKPGWAPTVELTWHMRAVPAPGWLALHGSGRLVSDGWFDEEVEVWDSAGRLVAQSRQIARVGARS